MRSLYRPGALKILIGEVLKYKIDVLAMQEMRWTGAGIMDRRDYSVYYSCQNRDHVLGTGFLVSRRMKANIIDFKPLTPRMCKIRLRGIFFNYTIINVHAPTDDKPEEEKDDFYDLLENAYASSRRHDIKIIIGDLNAKVGSSHACNNIGKYSLHSVVHWQRSRLSFG